MATATLSPARAIRRPRQTDWRALFGVFLFVVTTLGALALWGMSSDTRAVLVATRDRPAGASLSPTDLAVAHVRIDDTLYPAAVPAAEFQDLVGKRLAQPVHAQQLLVRKQLSGGPALGPGQVAMAIPISPDTAVGGRIQPGDAVQVLVTTNKGKPDARTSTVVASALVWEVGYQHSFAVVSSTSTDPSPAQGPVSWVSLILTPDQGAALAQARWSGDLDLVLLPPERP